MLECEIKLLHVFTSSDLVFDGLKAPYRESDPVSPVSVYGEQKVLAEEGYHQSLAAPRPPDVSLDSSKAMALGFEPLPLAKELQDIYEQA